MESVAVLGMAVGLAMDAFAVAMATSISLRTVTRRQVFRFAFHFGLFQAVMPMIGWLAGRAINPYIQSWDHWLAFVLLAFVGGKAICEASRGSDDESIAQDPTRGWSLVALSMATSIDALAVGLSFAMLGVSIWYPAAIIGIVTATLTMTGMMLGGRVGAYVGRRFEALGGLVLIAIGLKLVIEHAF